MHLSTKVRWNIRPKKNQKNKRNVLPLLTLGERRSSNNYCVIIGQCRLNYFVGSILMVCVCKSISRLSEILRAPEILHPKDQVPFCNWSILVWSWDRSIPCSCTCSTQEVYWKRIFFGLRLKLLLLVNQDQCIKLLFCLWGLESNTKKFNSPSQAATLGVMGFPSRPHHKSWRKRRKLYVLQHPHIWGSLQFMQL